MQKQENRPAQSINKQAVLDYDGFKVFFEKINGQMMINATQMAKLFDKVPKDWLKYQEAKELVEAVALGRNVLTADLVVVRRGGIPQLQGTWMQEEVALVFAQWLSPHFYLACNRKLKELLQLQVAMSTPKFGITPVIYENAAWYPCGEACKVLGKVKRPKAHLRKRKYPMHFKVLFGRNFVTAKYLEHLKVYYDYVKGNLLNLPL